MKQVFLFISICLGLTTYAQKNVIAVAQSALTGVILPAGSKQDKRFLSVLAGEVLLSTESKKAGTKLKNTEVLYLPSVATCGFNSDSLVTQLSTLGWNLIPVDGDDKFVWLQKDNRYIIAYLSLDKKATNLYFAEAETPPAIAAGVTNEPAAQQPATENQQ